MAARFDSDKVLHLINEIEDKFPVNDWKVNGLQVWPYIRTALAYSQNRNPDTRAADKEDNKRENRRKLHFLKALWKLPFLYFRLKKRLKTAQRIFLGARAHRAQVKGKLINRYYDIAMTDFSAQGEESVAFEGNLFTDSTPYFNADALFSLPALYMVPELQRRLFFWRAPEDIQLPEYDAFFTHLLATFEHTKPIESAFAKHIIIPRIKVLYSRTVFLTSLLEKTTVKKAYFMCYYSSLLYPMIAACNAVGIRSVDIQHGGMGEGHYSYGRWSKCPKQGYPLLPNFFWTWDQPSANMINAWAMNTDFHRAIAGGNPWTQACLRVYTDVPLWRDYVLVNMTTVTLDAFLVDTIKYFGDTKKWVLRMHPRHYQHNAQLRQQISAAGIADYTQVEDSREIPLPISLRYCSRFLSKASGSVIEAIELGMQPILFRSETMNYYEHFIRDEKVLLLKEDSTQALINALEIDSQKGRLNEAKLLETKNKFIVFETTADQLSAALSPS